MRSLIVTAFLLFGIAPAQAALLETINLPSNGVTINSTEVLALGTPYTVEVSGTFQIGCIGSPPCPTDAEYYVPSAGGNAGDPFDNTGFSNTPGVGLDVGVQINGINIDWGPFEVSRIYSILFIGLGDTIALRINDSNYGDNSGSLTVKIFSQNGVVPVPAAVWLFGTALIGLIGFSERRKVV